ncbi:hypothetical protein KFK09_005470 [Dendrobium nobile]|uniref:Uncharacterized protein n=1 Tax=Dendrobium nobile TaxID=94219 RepID=A0A8T3BVR6_DENNO|nr:hypothetical protein KFK09_005470 [Dendrobium nobile]
MPSLSAKRSTSTKMPPLEKVKIEHFDKVESLIEQNGGFDSFFASTPSSDLCSFRVKIDLDDNLHSSRCSVVSRTSFRVEAPAHGKEIG